MNISKLDRKRFYDNVSLGFGEDACWTWVGGISFLACRGVFWVDGRNRSASVVSYEIYYGRNTNGMLVCHTCDNPNCVNPNHLFLGTARDNTMDMISKKRHKCNLPKGQNHKDCKLSQEQVLEIRKKYATGNYFQKQLSDEYNVNQYNVSKIIRNITWKNIEL